MRNRAKGGTVLAAAVAGVLGGSIFSASAEMPILSSSGQVFKLAVSSDAELKTLRALGRGKLLAVGPIETVSASESVARVLGQDFVFLATPGAQDLIRSSEEGDVVALFGELTEDGYLVAGGMKLSGQYVPGVSRVYLQGALTDVASSVGQLAIGQQRFDYAATLAAGGTADAFRSGERVEISGTQPSIGGVVLASAIEPVIGASVGTGRTDASVGTGRTDASVGTGRTDASVGTGRTDASVGTG